MSKDRPAPTDQPADQAPAGPGAPPTDPEQIAVEWSRAVAALPKAKDVLELVSKMTLGLVGLSYALGLLVVNLHLYQYGVYSLNLLRLNYVIAGFWALVPVIICTIVSFKVAWLLLYYSNRFCAHYRFPPPLAGPLTSFDKKFIGLQLFYILGAILTPVVIMVLTVGFNLSWLQPLAIAAVLSWSLVNFSLVSITVQRAIFPRVYVRLFSASFLLLVTVAYILSFTLTIYGRIHSSLGGGAPKEVIIVFAEDDATKKLLDIAGFSFFPDSDRMAAGRILFVTEEEYILLPPDRDISLSVPRSSVKAVFYSVKIERR
jgi:hypothetical protein